MSSIQIYINLILLVYIILCQENYPIIPNPGYDTITIIPGSNPQTINISNIPRTDTENTLSIMTNNSITVNTSNINPKCTIECYTGCRILFPEYIEQKYCVSNICKCQVLEKITNLSNFDNYNDIYKNTSNVEIVHSEIHKYGATQYLDISQYFDRKNYSENYFYLIFYFIIFSMIFGYEFIVFKYIENINEFDFMKWLIEKNDNEFKKYRITKENVNEEINYNDNDNELTRCLI